MSDIDSNFMRQWIEGPFAGLFFLPVSMSIYVVANDELWTFLIGDDGAVISASSRALKFSTFWAIGIAGGGAGVGSCSGGRTRWIAV